MRDKPTLFALAATIFFIAGFLPAGKFFLASPNQPFQTTKEEGTGLGLYTCYGLMKSLGGEIKINSSDAGTEVFLSLPYSLDDEEEE